MPPDADDAFIAGWERARDFLATKAGFSTTALHRALREDVSFRFVNVARVESPDVWRQAIGDPEFPGGRMPFAAHPGLYEVVHEDGTPDGSDGVILINPFEVPADADESFLSGWHRAREALVSERGYLGTRLHRSVGPADFRFVNIARWSSPLMFMKAIQRPEFGEATATMSVTAHPALYQIVRG